MAAGVIGISFTGFEDWALTWLPIIFMGLICLLIGLTLRYMPRTKPQQIKPESSESIRWDDGAGARRSTSCSSRWTASPAATSLSSSPACSRGG